MDEVFLEEEKIEFQNHLCKKYTTQKMSSTPKSTAFLNEQFLGALSPEAKKMLGNIVPFQEGIDPNGDMIWTYKDLKGNSKNIEEHPAVRKPKQK